MGALLFSLLVSIASDQPAPAPRFTLDLLTPRIAGFSFSAAGGGGGMVRVATSCRLWVDLLPAFRVLGGLRLRYERLAFSVDSSATDFSVAPLLGIVLAPARALDPSAKIDPFVGIEAAFWAAPDDVLPTPEVAAVVGVRSQLGEGPFNVGAQLHVSSSSSDEDTLVLHWAAELVLISVSF